MSDCIKALCVFACVALGFPASTLAESNSGQIKVCASVPEIGALVQTVGMERVKVEVLSRAGDDPHFVEPKPSLLRCLNDAELYAEVGMELESAWVKPLLRASRNSQIQIGALGYLDCSQGIQALNIPEQGVSRALGDLHARGNPHYLLDPLEGVRVARLIARKLASLRPEYKAEFEQRAENFGQLVFERLLGPELLKVYPGEKLAELYSLGKLGEFLKSQGQEQMLGGWLGDLAQFYAKPIVTDHDIWPYFVRRFGFVTAEVLEPRPGIPPSTRHLEKVIREMKGKKITVILSTPYYDPRYAKIVVAETGAHVAAMAHQLASRPQTDSYLAFVDYNVRTLKAALLQESP